RMLLLTAAAAGLVALAAPARAAEKAGLDKYLPENASVYIHVRTKNLFTADVVRKTLPMVFDKYGDKLVMLAQIAKQLNPNGPPIDEKQLQQGIEQLKDPKVIAQGFDVAKDYAPEFVVSGPEDDPESMVVLIKADEAVTADVIDQQI